MHYGYDDLQYGKDRVGVLYTKFWTSLLYFRKDFALPCVRGCGMACIMVMMTYSMVRIELVYFIENSGLHYCTSEKTLPYHLFSPPTLFISDDKEHEDCVIH
nr:uncharacterized protein LOC125423922 isoform X1 [Ziziphus jujuba var. spinosa]